MYRRGSRRLYWTSRFDGWIGFVVFQTVSLTVGIAYGAHRWDLWSAGTTVPALRDVPIALTPRYDDPSVVSDEQLRAVLWRLRPKFAGKNPRINHVDHAMRLWGGDARFSDPQCLSGNQMQRLLLDHRIFANAWETGTAPLLIDSASGGVRVRLRRGPATSSHQDHLLAGQAEIGSGLDTSVRTGTRETTLRDVLEQSLRDFSLNQVEYEWSAIAYALYLHPTGRWTTSEGQAMSFDRLAERIMRQRRIQGVCYGNHRLEALVVILQGDEHASLLSEAGRARIIEYLADTTQTLLRTQHADGYWTRSWSGEPALQGEDGTEESDTLWGRVLATGHALEWWALAPAAVQPPREVVVKAAQWMCQTVEKMTDEQMDQCYTPLTHAGRALALWRGRDASDVALHFAGQH